MRSVQSQERAIFMIAPKEVDLKPSRIYDLRQGNYSAGLTQFSDKVLREIELRAAPLTHNYSYFVQHDFKEPARSLGEYAIELLTLGLEFRLYEAAAASTPEWTIRFFPKTLSYAAQDCRDEAGDRSSAHGYDANLFSSRLASSQAASKIEFMRAFGGEFEPVDCVA
jgi:hypothetical protein